MKTTYIGALVAALLSGAMGTAVGADGPAYAGDQRFFDDFWNVATQVQGIAQLAQTHSRNSDVQALGQQLLRDYSQAAPLEIALAQALGESPTFQISTNVVDDLNKLAGLTNAAFDQAALVKLVHGEDAVDRQLSLEISNSPNLAVRQLAAVLQAALKTDLLETQQLEANLNVKVRS